MAELRTENGPVADPFHPPLPPPSATSFPPITLPRPRIKPSTPTAAAIALPSEAPRGSCPGDGECNGQGGRACCNGCPAFNNRHGARNTGRVSSVAASTPTGTVLDDDQLEDDNQPVPANVGAMACENCGTTTTPLWRRDGEGRVACNVRSHSVEPDNGR